MLPSHSTVDVALREYTDTTKLWRCPMCGDEKPFATLEQATHPRWCLGENGSHRAVPTPMSLVEQERIYPSLAAWALLTKFERSDWGILATAVERDKAYILRSVRRRNPGAESVLQRGVIPRLDAMYRAFRYLRGAAPADTENGGRVVEEWPA